jgi:hypothetical protein
MDELCTEVQTKLNDFMAVFFPHNWQHVDCL